MIRITHLITDLSTGGAEMMLYKLLSYMDRRRFQNIVVSMTDKGACGIRIEALGVPVFCLGMRLGVPNPLGICRLLSLLRKERPMVLQTWLYHADLLGLLTGKLARVPVVVWNLRCSNMDMRHYSMLSAFVVRVLAKLSPFPEAILVNSAVGRHFHENLGYCPRWWTIIPNGFDLVRFRPDPEARIRVRRELGLSHDDILIGLIARFDPMKDHANFLRAACLLLEDFAGVHFVLVGRGVDCNNSELTRAISASGHASSFHLLGERSDIPDIMAASDIATSSSYGEGFPNIIGEAMACAVPCVVTDVGDSSLIVDNTGRVVPSRNPQALATAWKELIDLGKQGRGQLGIAARRRIQKHFSLAAIAAQYEAFYEELIRHVRNRRLHKSG